MKGGQKQYSVPFLQQPPTPVPRHLTPGRNLNPQLQFQKNYPKNVFIPLIEYLAEKGYKQAYEECVGTREQIQRKNVVSLDMIFNLTREPWFQRNINKSHLLINISNRILMNSKIKKKLFHLLIAQYILVQDCSTQIKEFKKNISRTANQIASQNLPTDELFTHPNSIIYLLTMFLKVFRQMIEERGICRIDEEFENMKIEEEVEGTSSAKPIKMLGSKQQYKYLVKQIVQLFMKRNLSLKQLTDSFQQIKTSILYRANQIRQQYHLIQKIPNWQLFIQLVVTRSFQSRRKDAKITNMIFNEWVNEYKSRSVSVVEGKEGSGDKSEQEQGEEKIEEEQGEGEVRNIGEGGNSSGVKRFTPIILTKNY